MTANLTQMLSVGQGLWSKDRPAYYARLNSVKNWALRRRVGRQLVGYSPALPTIEATSRKDAAAGLTVKAACLIIDLAIAGLTVAILFVLLTGGGELQAGTVRLRLRSVQNPLWEFTALLVLRYGLRRKCPFLGVRRFDLSDVDSQLPALARRALARLEGAVAARWIVIICLGVFLLKATLAWRLPGFFSGDDVEIHEMTLGKLLRHAWPVWELRNPFFPMAFILPAQRLALALGATDPAQLVFAGRLVVALVSTLAIPLTWLAARQLSPSAAVPLLAALLLAVNKLHVSFGSSELPRPVSAVFVLAAFVTLTRNAPRPFLGGVLLGCATAFRFSEAIFLIPAAIVCATGAAWMRIAILGAAWAGTAGAIMGVSDWLYWGRPFSSLIAAVDYTLVNRLSSRGYEPFYEYVVLLPTWSNWPMVLLAILGTWNNRQLAVWTWLPIAMLSCLPHKESRYLIPIVPFLSIGAALGAEKLIRAGASGERRRNVTRWGAASLVPLLIIACAHDAGGWRLARSNEEVRLARFLNSQGTDGVAVEAPWRLGGGPYLFTHEPIVEIRDERLRDAESRYQLLKDVRWIAVTSRTARRLDPGETRRLGFERDVRWSGQNYWLFTRAEPARPSR